MAFGKLSYFKEVKRPAMVEEFFSCFATIDRHNHHVKDPLHCNMSGTHIHSGITFMQQYLEST